MDCSTLCLIVNFDFFNGGFAESDLLAVDFTLGFLGGFGDGCGLFLGINGLGRRMPEVTEESTDGS